jgi:small subunit ribosomal protein S20
LTAHRAPPPDRVPAPRDATPYLPGLHRMANIQSQIKRNRQTIVRNERNKATRTELKTYLKRFETAVESGDKDAATTAYREVARKLDKAATKNIIKANKAANKKSRLHKRLTAL